MAVVARRYLVYDGVIIAPGAELPAEIQTKHGPQRLDLQALIARGDARDTEAQPTPRKRKRRG